MTEKELKKKYFDRVQTSTDPEFHDVAYKEYLVELYKLTNNQRIFYHLQQIPFQNGIEAIFAFILDEITPKEFYQLSRDKCVQLYIDNLFKFKLVTETSSSALDTLCEKVVFEALKGLKTLGKVNRRLYCTLQMTVGEKQKLRKQDQIAYNIWFNALEKLHKYFHLPPIKEFSRYFLPGSIEPIGLQLLLGNDFSKFDLKDEELQQYRELCR